VFVLEPKMDSIGKMNFSVISEDRFLFLAVCEFGKYFSVIYFLEIKNKNKK
jgi:hypothetical protein